MIIALVLLYLVLSWLFKSLLWPFIDLPHFLIRTFTKKETLSAKVRVSVTIERKLDESIPGRVLAWVERTQPLPKRYEWWLGLSFVLMALVVISGVPLYWMWPASFAFLYLAFYITVTAPMHYLYGLKRYQLLYKYGLL